VPVDGSIGQLVKQPTLQSHIGSVKPPAHSIVCELTFDENHCSRFKANDRISWTKSIIGKPLPRFAAMEDLIWSAFLTQIGLTLCQLSKIVDLPGIVFFNIIHSVVVSQHDV
jgi:hypothetical protein